MALNTDNIVIHNKITQLFNEIPCNSCDNIMNKMLYCAECKAKTCSTCMHVCIFCAQSVCADCKFYCINCEDNNLCIGCAVEHICSNSKDFIVCYSCDSCEC